MFASPFYKKDVTVICTSSTACRIEVMKPVISSSTSPQQLQELLMWHLVQVSKEML
jgi:hypothetical protein